jgi:hypothetical protein
VQRTPVRTVPGVRVQSCAERRRRCGRRTGCGAGVGAGVGLGAGVGAGVGLGVGGVGVGVV